jgi:dynein intermediate chain
LPQKERVIYNKEVQTTEIEIDATPIREEELRQHILREREIYEADRVARDKELEEESVRLDQEIEQEIKGVFINNLALSKSNNGFEEMTEEERGVILTAPEFLDFVEHSTKIIQRALNDNYDYVRDYTLGAESGVDDSEGKRVKRVCAFFDERYGKNRSITDVDWSPKVG